MKDTEFLSILKKEEQRQREQLQLIPSENYASKNVLSALGSVFTNKYSEGYTGKRYYQGNENIDDLEDLAVNRALKLFKSEYANVQPLSGSPANLAVYLGLLEQGDTILSMNLASGGHLSHGSPVNIVSKIFNVEFYDVDPKTNLLDYDLILQIAKRTKPKLIIAGASAYPRAIDFAKFKEIADQVGALLMADIAHIAGLVVSDQHMSPVPFADVVTTTTHKTLRGPRGGLILSKQHYANKISKAVFPGGIQAGPHNNVHASKAVAFYEALQPEFKD
jgi:glycine hydroxymethyltransferase